MVMRYVAHPAVPRANEHSFGPEVRQGGGPVEPTKR